MRMLSRPLAWLREASRRLLYSLPMVKNRLFYSRWGVELALPSELRGYVEGEILRLKAAHLSQLEQALGCLPRQLLVEARVNYLFIAADLRNNGILHDGVAYDFPDRPDPKWVGLNVSLFTQSQDETDLGVPLLYARLAEEIAHVWDYRLEATGSPYSSAGAEWSKVECDSMGKPRAFNIPNRKDYNLIVEDWASAVLWFVFQPDELIRISPERYEFVEHLFREWLPP